MTWATPTTKSHKHSRNICWRITSERRRRRFITILNAAFAGIPYTLFLPEEAYYHSILYLFLKLLGFAILAEPLTSQGRIDALLELPDKIYILEFKMSSAQVALDQIKNRHYDQPYRASGKKIILVGIAFDKEIRAIGDWKSETALITALAHSTG